MSRSGPRPPKEGATKLQQLRVAAGMTQAKAASAAGISLRRYLGLETGEYDFATLASGTLRALAEMFCISMDELYAAMTADIEQEVSHD